MRKVIPIIFVTAMTLDCAAHADGLTAAQHLKNPLTDDVSLAQLAGSAAGMSGSSVLSMLLSDSPSLRLFAGATTTGKVGAVVVAITVDNPAKSGTISLLPMAVPAATCMCRLAPVGFRVRSIPGTG